MPSLANHIIYQQLQQVFLFGPVDAKACARVTRLSSRSGLCGLGRYPLENMWDAPMK